MSKGGAGGVAANVLLLKKNEDKWGRWECSWCSHCDGGHCDDDDQKLILMTTMTVMMVMMVIRRQEQALQEAFRRADNSSEGKLTVEDYLKVVNINVF